MYMVIMTNHIDMNTNEWQKLNKHANRASFTKFTMINIC